MRIGYFFLFLYCSLFISVHSIFAQDPITVSAWVADHIPPGVPTLISPANEQKLTTGRPQFRWYYTTDNIGVVKYQLFIDGQLWQDNIPITSQTTSDYALDYDSKNQIYGLTPALTLTDGSHTWKIKAYDSLINNSESTTWTFTVDSLAPAFVINKIVDTTTSISAQDVATIPETAIIIPTRYPIIQGTGEANSDVVLVVNFLSGASEQHLFSIDSSGNWEIQLRDLPREQVISLDFTITDTVGHVSTLTDLLLQVAPATININIPGLAQPIIINPPPIVEPILEPVLEPKQTMEKIIYSPLIRQLPSSLQTATSALPVLVQSPSQTTLRVFFSLLGLIIIAFIPLVKISILLARFGQRTSPQIIREILRAIGLLGSKKAQGLVFAVETKTPVAFATIIFQGKTKAGRFHTQIKLANKEGWYDEYSLPGGNYQAAALAKNYSFPTLRKASATTDWQDFYRGQTFAVTNSKQTPTLLIPMDTNANSQSSLKIRLLKLPARNKIIFLGVTASLLLFPSVFNLAAVLVYLAINLNQK